MLKEISDLQSKLARGEVVIDAPCGAGPIIDLLGGIYARESINVGRLPGEPKFPNTASEFEAVKQIIGWQKK